MTQQSAPSPRGDDRLATRVSQSPPAGVIGGVVAILVMVLALAGVVPRVLFLVGAAGLLAVAYTLDKRFKANAPPPAAGRAASASPLLPPAASASAAPPVGAPSTGSAPPPPAAGPEPSLLPVGDLQAEHARLTRELTERVDDDEDVRFEKFMRLRKLEDELLRHQATPPA